MNIPKEFKLAFALIFGLFSTMLFVFNIVSAKGLVIIGVPSPSADATFLAVIFGFFGGAFTMMAIDEWIKR